MRSSKYSEFCAKIFGKFLSKQKKQELHDKNILLEKANINMEYEEYYSMVFINMIIISIVSIIFGIILNLIFPHYLTLLLVFFLPTITSASFGWLYLYLPKYHINRRAESIDRFLPYAINFISSMAVAGVSPSEIFKTLSTVDVYGEIQNEAKRIAKEINVMGIDNINALKHAIELSPSQKFKSFLQGMIGTIQSGSDLSNYLANIVDKYLEEDIIERKKGLDLLALMAETFVIAVIAFPIFLVIILSIMGFLGGSMDVSINILFLFAFFILPLVYVGFYVMIKSTSIEEISKYRPEIDYIRESIFKEHKFAIITAVLSVLSFFIFIILVYLLTLYGYIQSNEYLIYDIFFLSILILITPISFYLHRKFKIKKDIQERIPDFLIEIGDSLSSGMNTLEAIKVAEKGRYGNLNPEIKKMKTQLSWNISIKNVFSDFASRIKSGIIQRVVVTINEGLLMGGDTSKIFKAAATEVNQVNQIEHQRKANMSIYMSVIILCFFVFLAIILILDKTIFTSFFEIQAQQVEKMSNIFSINVIDADKLKYALFSFVFVQGMGAGVLAGFMMDGKATSGFRYGCVLALISFIVFKLLF